ncbi:hypothetical protein [Vibrio hepatarius]|uniref:hypothetical protein n=1 Tax=Vibrio hepatarius TaxID=171383 RepID=UPI001C07FAF5|nr:hypothetical protein [Vibrio hepatarius]MBU2896873.1 hypothetical protein [Vibrio hepatarius]
MKKITNRIKEVIRDVQSNKMGNSKTLNAFHKQLRKEKIVPNGEKILFSHSFSIYEPSFIHDKIMSIALKMRGCEVFSAFCDGVQSIECNVYGGVWKDHTDFDSSCAHCQKCSSKLWSELDKKNIYKYSTYITDEDNREVENIMGKITEGGWVDYKDSSGWEIGLWAKDILVNNYVVADKSLIYGHEELGRSHLKNLLVIKFAIKKIISKVKPTRIISNDSFYGMWKLWELIAKENGIPFYSHWSGTRVGGWSYAYNDASMSLNFKPSWESYSKQELTPDEESRVNQWLKDREGGRDMIIDTASLSDYKDEYFDFSLIDKTKPTALLSSNVVWDLAALNKEVFTSSMGEWIIQTIRWFRDNPDYQLIIKSHPAEHYPEIPQTIETVQSMLEKVFTLLPDNVIFISPKAAVSVYQLLPFASIGLVFTTSVGIEMAARGKSVIVAGKSHYRSYGFTCDPETLEEYFYNLERELRVGISDNSDVEKLAKKFLKFNFFHYYTRHGLVSFDHSKDNNGRVNILIDSIEDLKPGHNEHLDYILDSIVKGAPILRSDRWIKES